MWKKKRRNSSPWATHGNVLHSLTLSSVTTLVTILLKNYLIFFWLLLSSPGKICLVNLVFALILDKKPFLLHVHSHVHFPTHPWRQSSHYYTELGLSPVPLTKLRPLNPIGYTDCSLDYRGTHLLPLQP